MAWPSPVSTSQTSREEGLSLTPAPPPTCHLRVAGPLGGPSLGTRPCARTDQCPARGSSPLRSHRARPSHAASLQPSPWTRPSASRSTTDAQDSCLPGPHPFTLGGPQPPCSPRPLSALSPQVSTADPPAGLHAHFCLVFPHPKPPRSEYSRLSLPEGPVAPPRLCCWAWAHSSTRTVAPPPLEACRDCSRAWAPQGPSYPMPVARPPSLSLQDPAPALPRLGTAERLRPWEPGSWGGGM